MAKYAALFEDENDIINGTPQSRFVDMLHTTEHDTSKEVIDEIITNYACMEHIIKQTINEEKIDEHLKNYHNDHYEDIEELKKSLYMEFAANVVFKMPQ